MKTIKESTAYLVDNFDDVVKALRSSHPVDMLDYTNDQVFLDEAVYGINDLPKQYPYILVCDFRDDGFPHIDALGFPVSVFESDETSKTQMFEFNVTRTYLEPPYRERTNNVQIPAKDIFKAFLALGQSFHRNEVYDLKVNSWRKV